jgi:hypothetical protein
MSITWEHISFCVVVSSRNTWTFSEVEVVQGASVIVAADVIYSDDLTDAFFGVLERLMSLGSEKVYKSSMVVWPAIWNSKYHITRESLESVLIFD